MYSITASQMYSGVVLKSLNGSRFVMYSRYPAPCPAASRVLLALPHKDIDERVNECLTLPLTGE